MHVFHTVSKECFDWLSRQKSVKEESLTDWLLYRVSQLTPCVQYLTFTRNEEASIGADWEWWIITKDCCEKRKCAYRFLVQAKKLHPMKDNYPSLAYCNRNGLQIDLLYEAAKQRSAMPLYILYSANRPDYREQRIHMPNEYCDMLLKWCRSCINGVYFTSVYQIRELLFSQPRPQIPDQSILNRSLGLSVLDRFLFDRKELRHMEHYADEPFGKRFCNVIDNAANNRYFEDDFPVYLSVLLREGIANCAQWFEREYEQGSHGISDLAGIVIVDLTD